MRLCELCEPPELVSLKNFVESDRKLECQGGPAGVTDPTLRFASEFIHSLRGPSLAACQDKSLLIQG